MNPLNKEQIESNLSGLSGWSFESNSIQKQFQSKDFIEALSFVNTVGMEAEKMDHHPNWSNVYNQVKIELSTHDAGNTVTDKDRKLAEQIDKLLN